MNVLITSAGSQNGANVIKALRLPRALSWKNMIVACDCERLSAGLYLADKRYLVPKNKDPDFIPSILRIMKKEKINVVIPTYSTEFPVFAKNADKFKGKIVLSSLETYELVDNKPKWKIILKEMGIDVPEREPASFPIIIKPITGSGSKNQYIVNNWEDFQKYKTDDNFSEEYIEGQEYVIDGMSDLEGKMICCMPRVRLVSSGGGCKKAITVENAKLVDLAKQIAEKLGLVGAWNIQCIKRGNKYYFIDINNRFPSGGMPLAVASGINMPMMLIDLLQGKKIKPKLKYNLVMLRYDDEVIISEEATTKTDYISD